MSKIRWTTEERAALYKRAEFVYDGRMRRLDLMLKSCAHFPADRQRTQFGGKELKDLWEHAHQSRSVKTHQQQAPISTPPPAEERKGDPKERLGDLFEQLVDALVDRVFARLEKRLPSSEDAPAPVPEFDAAEARRNTRERAQQTLIASDRRPGVLIIGLLADQMQSISLDYMDRLSLSFRDTDAAKREAAIHRDHTVLMTKFISHSVHEKYKGVRQLYLCNGGMTDLRRHLDRIVPPVV
jgi:hypothetical protein